MRASHLASPVTYRRGDLQLVVNATFGKSEYEVENDYGLRTAASAMDFLVLADELTQTFGQPRAGDQVVADGKVHEVLDLAAQGCWRWSGPYFTTMRIHTREIGPSTGSGPGTL